MARTRRIIGQLRAPTVTAVLAALCISSLIFAAIWGQLRRGSVNGGANGFDSLRIIAVTVVAPTSVKTAFDADATTSEVINHVATGFTDDAVKLYDGIHIDSAPSVMPASAKTGSAAPAALDLVLSGYLPAKQLSLRPVVLKDIAPDLSVGSNAPDRSELIVQLLINEYGDVDRVIIDVGALPAKALAELEQRFLQMRFSPGRLYEKAVPTALRIEVTLQANLHP